ncbi:BLUF domain-containing protein [Allosphingosinicella deserti]|uniref:Blue light sensor protein n=1 Tax=Allosphingosinicella deserti TaxID=2116704 RepID=A0A2P7QZ84_9SPHN|nr:BLUF domain-containing protein [Sphingomonas deserti]PSJ43274.1 blue light sensor protein [Sphingomonas deserti]
MLPRAGNLGATSRSRLGFVPKAPPQRLAIGGREGERKGIGLKSLLYASASALAPGDEQAEVERIVSTARARNADLGVTGTLVFTRTRFAQILEGADGVVDALMARIARDPRHEQVTVVDAIPIDRRMFDDWTLSYSGGSRYVDKHIAPLLDGGGSGGGDARQLRRLMQALADAS